MVFKKSSELEHSFYRPPVKASSNKDVVFQAIDWADGDGYEKIPGWDKGKGRRVYKIRCYGVTEDGNSICVHIKNFKPYFYVKVPDEWDENTIEDFVDNVRYQVSLGKSHYYEKTLINTEIVRRKTLYWFDNERLYNFVKFEFVHKGGYNAYRRVFNEPFFIHEINDAQPFDFKNEIYQANIEPKLLFMHERDINASGWMSISEMDFEEDTENSTRCQLNLIVDYNDIHPHERNDIGQIIIASFDGEMKSGDGSFPVAKNPEDPVIQIGTTVHIYGETDVSFKYIVTLGDCTDFADDVYIERIPYNRDDPEDLLRAEKELLFAWATFIERLDPDILTGYNIWGFDMEYLFTRINGYEPPQPPPPPGEFVEWSCSASADIFLRMLDRRDTELISDRENLFIVKELNSSGLGENNLKYPSSEGMVQIDVMKVIQGDVTKKLESYKLDFVSEKFLGDKKIDLSPRQMFENFEDGSPEKIAEIAEYCVKDCALCNRLMMELAIDSNNIGMSNVCSVPFSYIFTRGQGIKLFSLVVKYCNKEDILCPVLNRDLIDRSSYEGAIVFTPKPGIYTDPIEVLDYASLYPSSMIAENISHDTIVLVQSFDLEGNLIKEEGDKTLMGLDGYHYNEIEYDIFKRVNKGKAKEGELDEIPDDANDNMEPIDAYEYLIKNNKVSVRKGKKKKKDKPVKIGYKRCFYIEKDNATEDDKGILPRIEVALLKARRTTRKKIGFQTLVYTDDSTGEEREIFGLLSGDGDTWTVKNEFGVVKGEVRKDSVISQNNTFSKFQQVILDGLQLAYKVTCNSLYGQVGATTSSICFKELAASTTAVGRDALLTAKRLIEAKYPGCITVYGDSVSGDTPVILRTPEYGVIILPIEDIPDFLEGKWEAYPQLVLEGDDKECAVMENVEVWCGPRIEELSDEESLKKKLINVSVEDYRQGGWKPLKKVIRHKTTKAIYRVAKNGGLVDTTSDHSVIGINGELIKPTEMEQNKTRILSGLPENYENRDTEICDIDEAWVMGLFMGNGFCNEDSWAIVNTNISLLEKAKIILDKIEDTDFEILEDYKLVPVGNLDYMVEKYRRYVYHKDSKWIHPDILNAKREIRQSFYDGYREGSDYQEKITIQSIYYLSRSLGYDGFGRDNRVRDVVKVSEEGVEKVVFDLETGCGRFNAGVGDIVVSNTDSVFVNFVPYIKATYGEGLSQMETRELAMKISCEAGGYVSSNLKHPQDLEREKQFFPFVIFSKKRYMAMKFEHDLENGYLNSMGVVTKRRDNARALIEDIYGKSVGIVLKELDVEKAKRYFQERVKALLNGEYSLEELKITKSVKNSGSYANPTTIAPRVLADRMYERDKGNKVMSNERLGYCFIDRGQFRCEVCDVKVNINRCKCRVCSHVFCTNHINNHRSKCTKRCRFCKEEVGPTNYKKVLPKMDMFDAEIPKRMSGHEKDEWEKYLIKKMETELNCVYMKKNKLFKCNTCWGLYCFHDMYRHTEKHDKKTNIKTLGKCKKAISEKLIQGDFIETPGYIREKGLKLDYKYYLEKQIMNPSMQFFGLVMDNPHELVQNLLIEHNRKESGMRSLFDMGFVKRK